MKIAAFIAVLVFLASTTAYGDKHVQIATLQERDLDNGIHDIALVPGIVDINSTITIVVDKAQLRMAMNGLYPQRSDHHIGTIREIQDRVMDGLKALPQMQAALERWAKLPKPSEEDRKALEAGVGPVAESGKKILRYASTKDHRLDLAINARLEALPPRAPSTETYRAVFDAAAEYVTEIMSESDKALTANGVYVQLGAWLVTGSESRPIHLPGFDLYPEGDFFEVERWKLAVLLDDQTQKKFEQAKQAAMDINNSGDTLIQQASNYLKSGIQSTFDEGRQCVSDLATSLDQVDIPAKSAADAARARTQEALATVRAYQEFLQSLDAKYRYQPQAVMENLPAVYADVQQLLTKTHALGDMTTALSNEIKQNTASLSAQTNKAINRFVTTANNCTAKTKRSLESVLPVLGMLVNGKSVAAKSLEYTDKVLKLDVEQLPGSVSLDLLQTGKRAHGDAIIIRVGAGQADQRIRQLQERQLRLHQVLTHVDVAVSLVFADPRGSTELKSQFQAAPSYSVLLKCGSRESTFFNELLTPGIGLNFAALDFNSDQAFELGIGMTLAAFQDYVQLGYGYNVNTSDQYWFFGLKFPLSSSGGKGTPLQ